MSWEGLMWMNRFTHSTGWTTGCTMENDGNIFSVGPCCGQNKCTCLLQKNLWAGEAKKLNGTSEEYALSYQSFIEYLYIQLICTKEYPSKYSYLFYSLLSFITSGAAAEKKTLIHTVLKIITNRGHKNKRLESNEVVKFLSNQVTKLCNSSTKKVFPHILDEKLHPYVSSEPWTPRHYHIWIEHILYTPAIKFMPISNI